MLGPAILQGLALTNLSSHRGVWGTPRPSYVAYIAFGYMAVPKTPLKLLRISIFQNDLNCVNYILAILFLDRFNYPSSHDLGRLPLGRDCNVSPPSLRAPIAPSLRIHASRSWD